MASRKFYLGKIQLESNNGRPRVHNENVSATLNTSAPSLQPGPSTFTTDGSSENLSQPTDGQAVSSHIFFL